MFTAHTSELVAEIADEFNVAPQRAMTYADQLLDEAVRDDELWGDEAWASLPPAISTES